MQFQPFDGSYLDRLRAGDLRTQQHFADYFGALIQIKLRSRLKSPHAIEDVRQETFERVLTALRENRIRQPERLGPFVNSICNNVLLEHYRGTQRDAPIPANTTDSEAPELPSKAPDPLQVFAAEEAKDKVREILEEMPERDRRLLREVFLEERDKDEVCHSFGVDRDYLRVLLHRATKSFKAIYLRRLNSDPTPIR